MWYFDPDEAAHGWAVFAVGAVLAYTRKQERFSP